MYMYNINVQYVQYLIKLQQEAKSLLVFLNLNDINLSVKLKIQVNDSLSPKFFRCAYFVDTKLVEYRLAGRSCVLKIFFSMN